MLNLNIVKFICEEVKRQGEGPEQVAQMAEAWEFAMSYPSHNWVSEAWRFQNLIASLAVKCEPVKATKYRSVPVSFANGNVIPADNIQRQMNNLCEDVRTSFGGVTSDWITAQEVYEEFERIHPFLDGNGRIGKILFNFLNGSLSNPVFPEEPDFSTSMTARQKRFYGLDMGYQ